MFCTHIVYFFVSLQAIKYQLRDMNVLELSEQEIGRRESLQELRQLGINPYPADEYPTNAFSTEIRDNFRDEDEYCRTTNEPTRDGKGFIRRVAGL